MLLLAACGTGEAPVPPPGPAAQAHARYLTGLDTLARRLDSLDVAAARGEPGATRHAFARARDAYKEVEYLLAAYAPTAADQLNGPALIRMADDDPNQVPIPPEGFQVIEELLYGGDLPADGSEVVRQTRVAQTHVRRVRAYATGLVLDDASVFDAMRLELARVASLGISGWDSPVAERGIAEAAAALRGVRRAAAVYAEPLRRAAPGGWEMLDSALGSAVAYAAADTGFAGFDRLEFLTGHLEPAAKALDAARRALGVSPGPGHRPWSAAAATLFDPGAFDAFAWAPVGSRRAATPAQVALGRRLFFEAALSGGGARSCAFCHAPARGFSDGRARSLAVDGHSTVARNAPTLVNAGLQAGSFYDLRATDLEAQISQVIHSPDEMGGDLDAAVAVLRRESAYVRGFVDAFGGDGPGAVTGDRLRTALAGYVRSLGGMSSRLDRELRGERGAMAAEERQGFNLFMGKARCGTCHFLPLFNGTMPPGFTEAEVEVLGVPDRPGRSGLRIDPDLGRAAITRLPIHRHAFKTPTLRNVALTAPYMHNGVYRTLEEVVDFYDAGGGVGLGLEVPNQTLPLDSLHLTRGEKGALVAFLEALTDTTAPQREAARVVARAR